MTRIFRFILTHPDMDHMDGIKDVFAEFSPVNFWDTANRCTNSFSAESPQREEDWRFYTGLRDRNSVGSPKRLTLDAGDQGPFYNQAGENGEPQDGLSVLAPTPALVEEANRTGKFNDASYVILYRSAAGRILFCGDSHNNTWDHLLANYLADIKDVELMIAPHHGRADPGAEEETSAEEEEGRRQSKEEGQDGPDRVPDEEPACRQGHRSDPEGAAQGVPNEPRDGEGREHRPGQAPSSGQAAERLTFPAAAALAPSLPTRGRFLIALR